MNRKSTHPVPSSVVPRPKGPDCWIWTQLREAQRFHTGGTVFKGDRIPDEVTQAQLRTRLHDELGDLARVGIVPAGKGLCVWFRIPATCSQGFFKKAVSKFKRILRELSLTTRIMECKIPSLWSVNLAT